MNSLKWNDADNGSHCFACLLCSKRTKPKDRRYLNGPSNKDTRRVLFKYFMIVVKEKDVICGKCRLKCYKHSVKRSAPVTQHEIHQTEYPTTKSPKSIHLQFPSLSGPSHSSCCICKRRGYKFINVPSDVRHTSLIEYGVIIPAGSRCCAGHICGSSLTPDSIEKMEASKTDSVFLNRTELTTLIKKIREIALRCKDKRIDFNADSNLQNEDYLNLIGVDKSNFDDMASHIKDIRGTRTRSMRNCLAILLTKLRSGMSNKVLSTVFNVSKDGVRRAIHTARKALMVDFTKKYIGFQHIDKQEIINKHTTKLAQTLFGNNTTVSPPAILVLDGTYIYIQKSMKFKFQRRSFSLHKGRPLVKPMMIVSTTGYIISVLGPYLSDSKNNDARIIEHAFKANDEDVTSWLEEGDVLIVDRGFRDCLGYLHELGFETEMPAFLPKGQKQHSVEESNNSRLVTKIRWIVESANGRIKQWKYLANIVPNTQIPYIGDFVSIVAAMCNRYLQPLASDNEEDYLLGCKMIYLSKCSNVLMQKVQEENLDKLRVVWEKMDNNTVPHFPNLDEAYLRNMTLGVYQLKLAKSYTEEHLNTDGQYELFVHSLDTGLIMSKIQSRHTSSKTYKLWISFDECIVKGWYCTCKAGARIVGTCAHIASVVWYLGYARKQNVSFNVSTDWSKYLKDAKDIPEPVEVNDSDVSDLEEEE